MDTEYAVTLEKGQHQDHRKSGTKHFAKDLESGTAGRKLQA
jgi:hypothetical protein